MNHHYAADPGCKTLAASCHKKSKNENWKMFYLKKLLNKKYEISARAATQFPLLLPK